MTLSIVQRLVLKDVYLSRWVILGSVLAGALSLAVAPLSELMFYAGSVAYICVLVVLNIFLVMSIVVHERKDKVNLFVLSLPVSTAQYTMSKIASTVVAFGVPWLLLTTLSLVVIDRSAIPNGLIPAMTALSAYLLLYHAVLFAVALTADSVGAMTAAIIAGNVSVNFAIPLVMRLSSVAAHGRGPVAVWGADVVSVVVIEIALALLALTIAFVRQSRRADFV
jgi:ABC-type transport system involved in multi-copper enzyme maturation permease subunit